MTEETMRAAGKAAEELLRTDPDLTAPEHRGIMGKIKRLFAEDGDIFN